MERTVESIRSHIHACDPMNSDERFNTILKTKKNKGCLTGTSYKLMFGRHIRKELVFMVEDTHTVPNKAVKINR